MSSGERAIRASFSYGLLSLDPFSFLREIVPLAPAFDQVRTLPFSGLTGVSFHTTFSTEDRSHEVVSAVLKDKVS